MVTKITIFRFKALRSAHRPILNLPGFDNIMLMLTKIAIARFKARRSVHRLIPNMPRFANINVSVNVSKDCDIPILRLSVPRPILNFTGIANNNVNGFPNINVIGDRDIPILRRSAHRPILNLSGFANDNVNVFKDRDCLI